jgi:hypothetical protein
MVGTPFSPPKLDERKKNELRGTARHGGVYFAYVVDIFMYAIKDNLRLLTSNK